MLPLPQPNIIEMYNAGAGEATVSAAESLLAKTSSFCKVIFMMNSSPSNFQLKVIIPSPLIKWDVDNQANPVTV